MTQPYLWLALGVLVVCTACALTYAFSWLPRRQAVRLDALIDAACTAIELRYPNHSGYATEVVSLCRLMGRELNLSDEVMAELLAAGRLRYVGLCTAPYALLNERSPKFWTLDEETLYWKSLESGAGIVAEVPVLRHLACYFREPDVNAWGERAQACRILRIATEFVWLSYWEGDLEARRILQQRPSNSCDRAAVDALLSVLRSSRDAEPGRQVAIA